MLRRVRAIRKARVRALLCLCQRCGYEWTVAGTLVAYPSRPAYCSKCKRRNWWAPVGILKPGPVGKRPRKAKP